MQLDITGRHVEITPALRQLLERRLARVERVLNDSALSATAILTLEKYRHRTEIIIHVRRDKMLRGLGEGTGWNLSIREAMEKVEQQAQKVKGKWTEGKRGETRRRAPRTARTEEAAQARRPEPAETASPRVIRATRYAIKPMTVDDAAGRVEESAEAFLVFRNAASDAVNILYRRKDGNLGLIETD
jgi:putative sigma-54 modulation protein